MLNPACFQVVVLSPEQEEINGALQAFLDAERKSQNDDGA